MVKPLLAILLLLFASPMLGVAQTEVPFTLEDRDRLIRLEERVGSAEDQVQSLRNELQSLRNELQSFRNEMQSLRNEMNTRFESVEKTQDTILTLMLFMLGAMVALFGFVLWDRRSAIRPLQFDVKNVEASNARIMSALREQAKRDPGLAEILKQTGVL